MDGNKHGHSGLSAHEHHYGVEILASLSFLVASVSLILLHKAIAIVYPYTFTVVLMQGLVTIVLNLVVMAYEWYYLGIKLHVLNPAELVQFLPVAGFFLVILITGFECLKYISVMTFIALRSLSCWTSYFGEVALLNRPFRWEVLPSLIIIAVGGVIYWLKDMEFNLTGYLFILLNIVAQSGFALYNKWLDKQQHYSAYTMSLYSNVIAVSIVILLAFIASELPNEAIAGLAKLTDGQHAILWLGGVARWLFSVTGFWCNALFSATAFTIHSTLNRVPTLLFSAWLFESHITTGMILGSTITVAGGLAYPLTIYYLEKKEEEQDHRYAQLSQQEESTVSDSQLDKELSIEDNPASNINANGSIKSSASVPSATIADLPSQQDASVAVKTDQP